jgi:hypothetical protein
MIIFVAPPVELAKPFEAGLKKLIRAICPGKAASYSRGDRAKTMSENQEGNTVLGLD